MNVDKLFEVQQISIDDVDCPECWDTGYEPCWNCGGDGVDFVFDEVEDGELEEIEEFCDECEGCGVVPCEACE